MDMAEVVKIHPVGWLKSHNTRHDGGAKCRKATGEQFNPIKEQSRKTA